MRSAYFSITLTRRQHILQYTHTHTPIYIGTFMQMWHACRICQSNNFRVHFLAAIKQPNNLYASSLIARWNEARIAFCICMHVRRVYIKIHYYIAAEWARQEAGSAERSEDSITNWNLCTTRQPPASSLPACQPAWLKVRGSKVQHMVAWSRLIMLRGVTFVSTSTVWQPLGS